MTQQSPEGTPVCPESSPETIFLGEEVKKKAKIKEQGTRNVMAFGGGFVKRRTNNVGGRGKRSIQRKPRKAPKVPSSNTIDSAHNPYYDAISILLDVEGLWLRATCGEPTGASEPLISHRPAPINFHQPSASIPLSLSRTLIVD